MSKDTVNSNSVRGTIVWPGTEGKDMDTFVVQPQRTLLSHSRKEAWKMQHSWSPFYLFVHLFLKIMNIFERQSDTERGTDRERKRSFKLLFHSPEGHNSREWDGSGSSQEPGTPSQFPTWVAGAHVLGPSSSGFPGTSSRS